MQKAFFSPINDYEEENENSIFSSNLNQNNNLFQPQDTLFFSNEQQNANNLFMSDYNDNIMNSPLFSPNQDFSPFQNLNSNEEDTNKTTNSNNKNLKPDSNEPISNESQKKMDKISKKDEKKNNEITGKKSNDEMLTQNEKKILNENLAKKIKENKLYNEENLLMNKKRKSTRIHLEDLNIDPKLIEKQSYQKIGDKVITSKTKMTEDDKKEVKALRNRISAQKNRDRKKAEFINLVEETRILKMKLQLKDLIIKKYKENVCSSCKKILEKIDEEFSENNINFKEDNKECLTLEENNTIFNKFSSNFGKFAGVFIGLVCIIGIIFCVFQSRYYFSTSIPEISRVNDDKTTIRHLSNNEQNLDHESIKKNVPMPTKKKIAEYEKYINHIEMCHNKFLFDAYSSKNDKSKQKIGFLTNKKFYKDTGSICLDSTSIGYNNYNLEDDCYALPKMTDNINLNNDISDKVITVFINDYETITIEKNGRYLTLQEQIELEAKKSNDGRVYMQIVIPNYESEENQPQNENNINKNDAKSYFEIRCKILEINNYNSKED